VFSTEEVFADKERVPKAKSNANQLLVFSNENLAIGTNAERRENEPEIQFTRGDFHWKKKDFFAALDHHQRFYEEVELG
jgi:hypothetical protein